MASLMSSMTSQANLCNEHINHITFFMPQRYGEIRADNLKQEMKLDFFQLLLGENF